MIRWFLATLFILTSGTAAMASTLTYQKKILVSVGDLQEPDRVAWKKEICTRVYLIANQINASGVDVTCRQFDTGSFVDKALVELKNNYSYHVRILRSREGHLQVDVTNWSRINHYDFQTLGWSFAADRSTERRQEEAFTKVLANFFFFTSSEEAFQKGILIHGISESNYITYDFKNDVFREVLTNDVITTARAMTLFHSEGPRQKNYLKSATELGVALASGIAVSHRENFQGPTRLDIPKPEPKNNGVHSLEIFLMSQAVGAQWDFFEYADVFKVNVDNLQPLTRYLLEEAQAQQKCALAEGSKMKNLCKKKFWSQLTAQVGTKKGLASFNPAKNPTFIDNLSLEIIDLNDMKARGDKAKLLIDSVAIKLMAQKRTRHPNPWRELKAVARIVTTTYNQRKTSGAENGQVDSYDVKFDFSDAALTEDEQEAHLEATQPIYGRIDFLGATAKANIMMQDYVVQVEFGIHGDVAMMKSYAVSEIGSAFNNSGIPGYVAKSQRDQYYWGYGTTTLAAVTATRNKIKFGYEWRTIKTSDLQIKELGQIDPYGRRDIEDNADSHKIFVRYRMTKNLSFQVALENISRTGSMRGVVPRSVSDNRVMGTLKFVF